MECTSLPVCYELAIKLTNAPLSILTNLKNVLLKYYQVCTNHIYTNKGPLIAIYIFQFCPGALAD